MHRYALHDERVARVFALAAGRRGGTVDQIAVFVHCGVLSVGIRKKLNLPSPFEMRFGNPLDLHALALRHPNVPIIIPHFGAGMLREALMLADCCPNVHLDTSSSNSWVKYTPGLTLEHVFKTALEVVGPDRLIFGTDSSFFPRGWHHPIYERQRAALTALGVAENVQTKIFGDNFARLFA
jgi:predicted TIM-barrel fold metal-dependent hydrolase